jgi:hypothetical protein
MNLPVPVASHRWQWWREIDLELRGHVAIVIINACIGSRERRGREEGEKREEKESMDAPWRGSALPLWSSAGATRACPASRRHFLLTYLPFL